MSLSQLERDFINRYQGGFPLLEHPYQMVAADLGCTESTLLDCIRSLLDSGKLSRFGPLYDAARLGGGVTLAALSAPEEHYEQVASAVNQYAEVAHNYRREHQLNMWFVLATDSSDDIGTTLHAIEQATGLKVYSFPKQHEFYIGLWLKLDAGGHVDTIPIPAAATVSASGTYVLDELDRKIVSLTQTGLPLVHCPYQTIADQCGCLSQEIKQRLQIMLGYGVIRRVGAVPNHYRLGLKSNGMTVWDVPDELTMELGRQIGKLNFVSHCYLRPRRLPVWRYNLFAMVHGHTRGEVHEKAAQIEDLLGRNADAHEVLFSTAILKKTGLRLAA